MTSLQFIAVVVRLFAIWLGLLAAQTLVPLAMVDSADFRNVYVMSTVIYAALACALWVFPLSVANRILGAVPMAHKSAHVAESLVQAGIICAGLLILADSLPPLTGSLAMALGTPYDGYADSTARQSTILNLAMSIGQLVLSLILILRSDAFAHKLQPRDRTPNKDSDL